MLFRHLYAEVPHFAHLAPQFHGYLALDRIELIGGGQHFPARALTRHTLDQASLFGEVVFGHCFFGWLRNRASILHADQIRPVDQALHDANAGRIDHHAVYVDRAQAVRERFLVGGFLGARCGQGFCIRCEHPIG